MEMRGYVRNKEIFFRKSSLKFVLILGLLIFVILFIVAVLNVTLTSPLDNYRNITGEFNLTCFVTDNVGIVNVTLYHNFSGTWHANNTINLTGTSNSTYWTFSGIDSGTYIWNCLSYNSVGESSWAGENKTIQSGGYNTYNASSISGSSSPSDFQGSYNFRISLSSSFTTHSGDKIRAYFPGASNRDSSIINPSIGQRDGSSWNIIPGTIVNFTIDGQRNYTIPQGAGGVWTDWVDFNFSSDEDYLIQYFTGTNSSSYGSQYWVRLVSPKASCFNSTASDFTSQPVWSACIASNYIYGLSYVEVYTDNLSVNVNSPSNYYNLSSNILPINFSLQNPLDYQVSNCSIYSNLTGSWQEHSTNDVSNGNNIVYISNISNYDSFLWGLTCPGTESYLSSNYSVRFVNYSYVAYGDSVTLGLMALSNRGYSYMLSNSSYLNYTEINSGESGTLLITTGVNQVVGRVVNYLPLIVFLQYGLNDFRYVDSNETIFKSSYDYVVKKIANSTNSTIVIGTLSHMNNYSGSGDPDYSYGNRTVQGRYNNIIQEVAAENNISVSQIYYNMRYDDSYVHSDGLHPNNAGHVLIANVHNQTYWAGDTQSLNKWDVYSSVANFTFMNYTFNMIQHPHETDDFFILTDVTLNNFTYYSNQSVDMNTSERYNSYTNYNITRINNSDSTVYSYLVNSSSSGNISLTMPVGNYTYSISVVASSDVTSPTVNIISPTSNQNVTSSSLSLSITTNENSNCNYSINSGITNSSLTANSTGTGHTGTLSSLTTGSYNLNVYCNDLAGNLNNSESVNFSVSISSSSSNQDSSTGTTNSQSGGTATYSVSEGEVEFGYSKRLKERQKVRLNIKEEERVVEVKEVSEEKVILDIGGESYFVSVNSSEKIDFDSDGIYDLEISNFGMTYSASGTKAELEFKEITEEILSEKQDDVNENVEVDDKENVSKDNVEFWKKLVSFFGRIWDIIQKLNYWGMSDLL